MAEASLGIGTNLPLSVEDAISAVKEALKVEGFGVLTEIDVKKTLKEKIGEEVEPYVILGACNPRLAHRALTIDPEIGLLLPCNVVVRAAESGARIDIIDPIAMLSVKDHPELKPVADEAKSKLTRVVESLALAKR